MDERAFPFPLKVRLLIVVLALAGDVRGCIVEYLR